MLESLSENWWLVALRGFFAILFGILAIFWPSATIGALVILFGVYALLDGIAAFFGAFTGRETNSHWWVLLLEGIIGVAAAVITFVYPIVTAVALIYLVAGWAILTGILEIGAAIRLRQEISGEWLLALSGVVSIIFGFLLAFFPTAGAVTLVWIIAAYALVFGIMTMILGFKLRDYQSQGESSQLRTA